jgi:hypothetical protein
MKEKQYILSLYSLVAMKIMPEMMYVYNLKVYISK